MVFMIYNMERYNEIKTKKKEEKNEVQIKMCISRKIA